MDKSLAMIEYATVSTGMAAADLLAKTARIRLITAKTVCPGKYLVMFYGELSAIKSAVEAVKLRYAEKLVDSFVLGNPHPSILGVIDINAKPLFRNSTVGKRETEADTQAGESIYRIGEECDAKSLGSGFDRKDQTLRTFSSNIDTIGIIETTTSAAAVLSADIAAKAAKIRLLEIHLANRMCGKAYTLFCGALASVNESVAIAKKDSAVSGCLIDNAVIPAADKDFIEVLMNDLRERGM